MADRQYRGRGTAAPNSMMLRRTLLLLVVCGIVAFLVLAIRLFQLQVIDHELYESAAIEQQVRETTVYADRGAIYDSNGSILAMSATAYTVNISPREIEMYDTSEDNDNRVTKEFIAMNLSEILEVDYDGLMEKLSDSKSWYKTVARRIEPEVADQIRAFKNEYGLIGVRLDEDSKRYYPYGSLAAHVVGFVGAENTGLSGLEYMYNDMLAGVNGRVVRARNAAGTDMLFTSFEDYYDAQTGSSIYTTIDANIQYYLEKHLKQAVIDYDVQNGAAAIAMDVNTGAIRGMVSLGDFDLNDYQAVSEEAQARIDAAPEEPTEQNPDYYKSALLSEAQLLQWRNKAISDTYEPGSTFKIITLAMALNEGVVNDGDTFYCGGNVKVQGDDVARNCWKKEGHGSQTLTQCLQHSCNVAFINIGQMIGAETFYDYCEAFGFFEGNKNKDAYLSGMTGIDLLGESGSIWWPYNVFCNPYQKSQLAAASFGQTFNITPLQLITAVSACCNGGELMQPYLVNEIVDENGESIVKTEPTVVRRVICEETSVKIREIMEQVVGDPVEGTGKNAAVVGYRIGGKTGTSEKVAQDAAGGAKEYIVSFIGVAPIDDPEIAVLVLLDTPGYNSGVYISGGQMAAPTVGKIFTDILPYMGYDPNYTDAEMKVIDRAVPELLGDLDAAVAELEAAGFTYRVIGSGQTVTSQLPAANTVVAADSQIILYCGDAVPSESLEEVPNVTGISYSVARQSLGAYALYVRTSGSISDSSKVMVTGQSIAPGTMVKHGTVIEVTVVDTSDLGIY